MVKQWHDDQAHPLLAACREDMTEQYKGHTIRAFEQRPGSWLAEIGKENGSVIMRKGRARSSPRRQRAIVQLTNCVRKGSDRQPRDARQNFNAGPSTPNREPRSIRPRLNVIHMELVVVDHSCTAPHVGFVVPLDDSLIFNGSALLDHCLLAIAIAMNNYAGGGSGTNSDSHFHG